jgi:hypothetical protein
VDTEFYEPPPPDDLWPTVTEGDLRFNQYARRRMRGRGVTEHDVRYVMANPRIERPSKKGTVSGRWETTGTDQCGRDIRVVWAPAEDGQIIWVTNAIVLDRSMFRLTGVWPVPVAKEG